MTGQQIAELRGLLERATQENLADSGRYFADSFDDLTRCRHEEIGEYQNRHDGPAIEALWNARYALLASAEREVRYREGLEPFADPAGLTDAMDEDTPMGVHPATVRHIRAARALLAEPADGGEG